MVVWNTSQRPEIIGREAKNTKYLGGHCNILAGLVTLISEPFLHRVYKVHKLIAAPLNPMDSFLLARGLRTPHVKMQRYGENTMVVARMLDDHPMVAEVYYPGLESRPDRDMADSAFLSGRDCEEDREYIYLNYGGWYPSWSRARTTTRRCVGLGMRVKTFNSSTSPYFWGGSNLCASIWCP